MTEADKNTKKNYRIYILRILLTAATAALTAWIFSNSLKNASQSTVQSSGVKEWLQNILNSVFGSSAPVLSSHFVRKAAHFSEYALLGFMACFTCLSYTFKKKFFIFPYMATVLTACIDEGLQFFSEGRAPAWMDVGIDSLGGTCGFLLALAIIRIVFLIIDKKRKDRDGVA